MGGTTRSQNGVDNELGAVGLDHWSSDFRTEHVAQVCPLQWRAGRVAAPPHRTQFVGLTALMAEMAAKYGAPVYLECEHEQDPSAAT